MKKYRKEKQVAEVSEEQELALSDLNKILVPSNKVIFEITEENRKPSNEVIIEATEEHQEPANEVIIETTVENEKPTEENVSEINEENSVEIEHVTEFQSNANTLTASPKYELQ